MKIKCDRQAEPNSKPDRKEEVTMHGVDDGKQLVGNEGDQWLEFWRFRPAFDDRPGTKAFQESLMRLDSRVDWVPLGWQRLYGDLRMQLHAIAMGHRQHIQMFGPRVEEGCLMLDVEGEDPVVRGLVRKACARARCTCMQCGRPGISRVIHRSRKVLCSACAGIELLEHDLQGVLDTLGRVEMTGASVWLPADALSPRIRALVQGHAVVSHEAIPGGVQAYDMGRLRPWLQRVCERIGCAAVQD